MNSTQSRKRLHELANWLDDKAYERGISPIITGASDLRALLASERELRRELALIRKLARMSGVDKHWWKVGGVNL